MTLKAVYDRAASEGVVIDWFWMRVTKAIALPSGCIALNPDMIGDADDEKTTLAHELGHIETGSFYSVLTPLETRERCEHHADKRAIQMLIPLDELRECFRSGCRTKYDVAQYFGVTEQLVEKAMFLYEDQIREWDNK